MLAVLLAALIFSSVQAVLSAEIDRIAYVSSVHDGDTFTLSTGEKVRLADLDAPELGEAGADEATDYLDSLVYHKTVYLDVDDKYTTDSYGRLVCVVYIDYNSTHYLNVNKALIDGGYVEARNYDNEFNYNSFISFFQKSADAGSADLLSTYLPIFILAIAILFIVIIAKMRR